MIVGLGIDIVTVSRIEEVILSQGEAFLKRLFTPNEQAYCRAKRNPYPYFAARFAAKEAFSKALGSGMREGMAWVDIEVVHDELGCPFVRLQGGVQSLAERLFQDKGALAWHLSLSHTDEYAAATVVLECKEQV